MSPKHSIGNANKSKMKIPSGSASNQSNPSPPNEPVGNNHHRRPPAPNPSTSQPQYPSHLTRQPRRPSRQPTSSPSKPHVATLSTPTRLPPHQTSPPKPSNLSPPRVHQSPSTTTASATNKNPIPPASGKSKHTYPSTPLKETVKGPQTTTRVERVVAAEVARMALGGVWRVGGKAEGKTRKTG